MRVKVDFLENEFNFVRTFVYRTAKMSLRKLPSIDMHNQWTVHHIS